MSPSREPAMREPTVDSADIRILIEQEFGLNAERIRAVGRNHYNITFEIDLATPNISPCVQQVQMPGTVPIPAGTSSLVLHIPKGDAGVDPHTQTENKVAMMALMRLALASFQRNLIPDVYGWSSSTFTYGWILEEHKAGTPAEQLFPSLEEDQQAHMLRELARIVKAFQDFKLPESFVGLGGAGFDRDGRIVSRTHPLIYGGPFPTISALYASAFETQLALSETSQICQGWRRGGLRELLERFISQELRIDELLPTTSERALIHGGIELRTLLLDPATFKITGLLHFDFAHVSSPLEEHLYSFGSLDGILPGPLEEFNLSTLREYILTGFPSTLPPSTSPDKGPKKFGDDPPIQWQTARTWADQLIAAGARTPRTIECAERVSALHWFVEAVCPFYTLQQKWIGSRSPEQLEDARAVGAETLDRYLRYWGY